MGWKKCPHCREPVYYDNLSDDVIHECNSGKKALDEESRIRIDEPPMMLKGLANTQWGTDAAIDGAKGVQRDERGKPKALYKSRQHYQYIKLK